MPGSLIPENFNFGGFGVDIFFVISGFIMWVTTENGRLSSKDFWIRRIKRIVPLYWVFTSMLVVVGFAIPWALQSTVVTVPTAVMSYLFIPHYYSNVVLGSQVAPLLGTGWTLNYEMFFYLIFGITIFPLFSANRLLLITLFLVGLVFAGQFIDNKGPFGIVYTNQLLLEFLFGIYLGRSREKIEVFPNGVGVALIVSAFLMMLILFYCCAFLPRIIIFGIPATLLIAGGISIEKGLKARPVVTALFLGDASYSLYLSHLFALQPFLILARWEKIPWLLSAVSAIGFAFFLGTIVYLFCERPITNALSARRPRIQPT
jgi:exopolysaccharide production protein ExoZ